MIDDWPDVISDPNAVNRGKLTGPMPDMTRLQGFDEDLYCFLKTINDTLQVVIDRQMTTEAMMNSAMSGKKSK